MLDIQDALRVSATIRERLDPVAIILFGSVARTGNGNDLDFLVVTEGETGAEEVERKLRDLRKNTAADCFVVSANTLTREFLGGSRFLRRIQKEGRLLHMKSSLDEWVRLALDDLAQAEHLLKGNFFRGACYNAQQALEKAVKAELLRKGWELERIHSIRRLLGIAEDFNVLVEAGEADVDFMDGIYRGRYPAEEGLLPIGSPSAEDARRALDIAAEIMRQLKIFRGKIPSTPLDPENG